MKEYIDWFKENHKQEIELLKKLRGIYSVQNHGNKALHETDELFRLVFDTDATEIRQALSSKIKILQDKLEKNFKDECFEYYFYPIIKDDLDNAEKPA